MRKKAIIGTSSIIKFNFIFMDIKCFFSIKKNSLLIFILISIYLILMILKKKNHTVLQKKGLWAK